VRSACRSVGLSAPSPSRLPASQAVASVVPLLSLSQKASLYTQKKIFNQRKNIIIMKKLLAIAIVASAFTFTSCGGSIANKAASCSCEMAAVFTKIKKEIDEAPEDKKAELEAKAKETMKTKPACFEAIDVEIKKMKSDTTAAGKEKYQALRKEIDELTAKKCGDLGK
jgi:hypothetical protein